MALFLLAGCVAPPPCHVPFEPTYAAVGTPAEGGVGDRLLQVTVLEDVARPDTRTIHVLWPRDGVWPDVNATSSHIVLRVLALQSAAGIFTAHVPSDRSLRIVAAGSLATMSQMTAQEIPAGTAPVDLTMRLLQPRLTVMLDGMWSGPQATLYVPPYTNVQWDPHPIEFNADPAWSEAYTRSLRHFSATLSWTNGAQGIASFGVAADLNGGDADNCSFQDGRDETTSPGLQKEGFDTDDTSQGTFCFTPTPLGPDRPVVYIGPATPQAAVGLLALPYSIDVTAQFDSSADLLQGCTVGNDQGVTLEFMDAKTGEITSTQAGPTYSAPPAGLLMVAGVIALAALARRGRDAM